MRIYLDTCALNRLTDDPSQQRVRIESNAVERVFQLYWKKRFSWIASFANEIEIRRNPNSQMRRDGLTLLSFANEMVLPGSATRNRSFGLKRLGYGALDALHLACAEQGRVDVLLTADDRFISRASRKTGGSGVTVINPVDWLKELDR